MQVRWTEKGVMAREFTLKLPNGGDYSTKNRHLPMLISRKKSNGEADRHPMLQKLQY